MPNPGRVGTRWLSGLWLTEDRHVCFKGWGQAEEDAIYRAELELVVLIL